MSNITQAVAKADEQKERSAEIVRWIERQTPEYTRALPAHVDPERFTRCAITAIRTVKNLDQCSLPSILAGIMQSAQLGLEISDVRGQSFLIPRWSKKLGGMEATFQLGYRGMIDLAARGGITVDVAEVCEGDTLTYQEGTDAYLRHTRALKGRGEAYAYYAVAHFSDGRRPQFKIMGRTEMEEHRDKFASSKTKDGEIYGPWIDNFDAMARKTVVRALLNYLPATVELRQQLAIEAQSVEDAGTSMSVAFLPAELDVPTEPDVIDVGEITHTEADQ